MNAYDKKKDKQYFQISQWKKYLKDAKVKTVEDLYKKAHAKIRKNLDRPEKKEQ